MLNFKNIEGGIEFCGAAEIRNFPDGLLRDAVEYLAEHSGYYRRMFRESGIDVGDIRTIDDLAHIPFTEKRDLQLYNEEFLCCPKAKIVDYITTSGTLGEPVTFGLQTASAVMSVSEKIGRLCGAEAWKHPPADDHP